jgi:hypothetical protein
VIANDDNANNGGQVARLSQILGEWIDRQNRQGSMSPFIVRLHFRPYVSSELAATMPEAELNPPAGVHWSLGAPRI